MATKREPATRLASSSSSLLRSVAGNNSMAKTRQSSRKSSMRPPSSFASSRSVHNRDGAISPAGSVSSVATAGTKRKERDFESDVGGEETNINVVVRCRGRNEREVRENSAVVVQADGVKGKMVDLSLGPSALSNKTYNFDRVFSAAADQVMVFDDVVKPILDEMLAGFNCTIFAYGQTGTGKTYTMSGDMSETMGLLSDAAGIIPRALHALFNKLEIDEPENCIKCSFIELYNEELRDLISVEENAKLKIYDDISRKGHATTIVQGVEEKHIKTAGEGIKVLQEGSLKRQVAATKCNDLSSRSHTVFTITAYVRRKGNDGSEEFVSAGKLNLVDLAGSENIQRSGAENKRAAEAGLINKSLLTLGRVINALVDKSQHIPYRESKLTRLLQDSLGGRTKTCIIATVSPAKSNLEETISTLDYAFRAKNIRNKPQVCAISKKRLLNDFATEIEKLKSELITTRQRNGVYLSNEAYEDMTTQNESRRIILEEQAAKMETLEANLKNKVQEFFNLTSTLMGLKKDHEGIKARLDETKEVLDQTELVLDATRKTLAEETHLRKAHQNTEEKLTEVGGELISALHKTVHDVDGLRAKNKRKSDLQVLNRTAWGTSQDRVAEVTSLVEERIAEFQDQQRSNITGVSRRLQSFMDEELEKLTTAGGLLDGQLQKFAESKENLLDEKEKSKDELDDVLEEIKVVRDTVKEHMGDSLQVISGAAEKIAADVVSELDTFHNQLHGSFSSLGKDFKTIFEDLVKHITAQRTESDKLRRQLQAATEQIVEQNATISTLMQEALEEENNRAVEERQHLQEQVAALFDAQARAQEARLAERTSKIQEKLLASNTCLQEGVELYDQGMDAWDENEGQLLDTVVKSRDAMKAKLKEDWNAANEHSTSIRSTTQSANAKTMEAVDTQLKNLDAHMQDLDDLVTRARSENSSNHEKHAEAMENLSSAVVQSFDDMASHTKAAFDRAQQLSISLETHADEAQEQVQMLDDQVCEPLTDLREEIAASALREYEPTGETPAKTQYRYPTELPRTQSHGRLLADLHKAPSHSPSKAEAAEATPVVFADLDHPEISLSPSSQPRQSNWASTMATIPERGSEAQNNISSMSLREVNPNLTTNLTTGALLFDPHKEMLGDGVDDNTEPLFRRSTRKQLPRKTRNSSVVHLEGRENVPLHVGPFSQSLGPRRKSPRLN